jgi:hypothetical protein
MEDETYPTWKAIPDYIVKDVKLDTRGALEDLSYLAIRHYEYTPHIKRLRNAVACRTKKEQTR